MRRPKIDLYQSRLVDFLAAQEALCARARALLELPEDSAPALPGRGGDGAAHWRRVRSDLEGLLWQLEVNREWLLGSALLSHLLARARRDDSRAGGPGR